MKTVTTVILCSLLLGCQPDSPVNHSPASLPAGSKTAVTTIVATIDVAQLHHSLRQQGELSLRQTIASAQALLARSQQFLASPDAPHWQQLQNQWLASHQQWHHSAVYLQLLPAQAELEELNHRLHDAEISDGYLDSVAGYPQSGIVNDSTLAISLDSLIQQHRRYSDEEAALGLSVLEFFIWGRELNHYREPADALATLAIPRRRQYLALLAQQWLSDVENAHQYWQDHSAQLPDAAAIRLQWQQQLGALTDTQHSPYSHDQLWITGALSSISKHSAPHPGYAAIGQLLQQGEAVPEQEQEAKVLNQQLGALMLNLRLKTSAAGE
ncbi:imelysin family protein [Dasania marina]|uniref:imelysin family protein n=1 Tax=Dasania marina TaxID=471499 RepID=UPI0030DC36EA